ncbi:MAG: GFA family protein [Parvibaculaceae bacterium]
MTTRGAACACGQLRITCEGEPARISICHCLDCQRRTGAPFGMQARYGRGQVTAITGERAHFTRAADSGNSVTFSFCPHCGSTVFWELSGFPDVLAVAVGAFADPQFPAPRISVHERRRHRWVDLRGLPDIERLD